MKVHIRHIIFVLFILSFSNVISQTVYTTKSGRKYHRIECRYIKYSKYKTTIDKAKQAGYTACKVCRPTLVNTKVTEEQAQAYGSPTVQKKLKKRKTAHQCRGKTKSGVRCKRMTKNANKRCYQHQPK